MIKAYQKTKKYIRYEVLPRKHALDIKYNEYNVRQHYNSGSTSIIFVKHLLEYLH